MILYYELPDQVQFIYTHHCPVLKVFPRIFINEGTGKKKVLDCMT